MQRDRAEAPGSVDAGDKGKDPERVRESKYERQERGVGESNEEVFEERPGKKRE